VPPNSRHDAEAPVNERILSLVTTLSERVQHLESKLDGLGPRKRLASEFPNNETSSESSVRPLKQQSRRLELEAPPIDPRLRQDEVDASEQNSSDEAQEGKSGVELSLSGQLRALVHSEFDVYFFSSVQKIIGWE
jgi:hypothetical protein